MVCVICVIIPWIIIPVVLYLTVDPYVLVVIYILHLNMNDIKVFLPVLFIRTILCISVLMTTLRALLVVGFLSISAGMLSVEILKDVLASTKLRNELLMPAMLLKASHKHNVVTILYHLTYLVRQCAGALLGTGAIVIVLFVFLTVHGFSNMDPILYSFFPFGTILSMIGMQLALVIFQSIHDSSLVIKNKLKLKYGRMGGCLAKKIRAMQEIKFYLSLGDFNITSVKKSTRVKMNEAILLHSLSILTVPVNKVAF